EDGIRDLTVTGVQTCALPISVAYLFRWFGPPQKMIAPFPSLTEICYSAILHAPPLPGVIDQYFDPRDGQRKAMLWKRIRGYSERSEERRVGKEWRARRVRKQQ